jgi:mRNA interferase MazF
MALSFHPNLGAILACDYEPGFKEPEMVKRRPVVVITPRLRRRDGLCTVVPLSTLQPEHPQDYHLKIRLNPILPPPWDSEECWVKADMLATVGYHRLSPIRLGRVRDGTRIYYNSLMSNANLRGIQRAVLCALNLKHLTEHIKDPK